MGKGLCPNNLREVFIYVYMRSYICCATAMIIYIYIFNTNYNMYKTTLFFIEIYILHCKYSLKHNVKYTIKKQNMLPKIVTVLLEDHFLHQSLYPKRLIAQEYDSYNDSSRKYVYI